MDEKLLPGLDTLDEGSVNGLAAAFRARGWFGVPIVVVEDLRASVRWIASDPHRYAAAKRAGVEPRFIRVQDVFEEDGTNYWEAIEEERRRYPTDSATQVQQRLRPGSNYWWDIILDTHLSHDAKAKYWSEQGDGQLPLGQISGRLAPGSADS